MCIENLLLQSVNSGKQSAVLDFVFSSIRNGQFGLPQWFILFFFHYMLNPLSSANFCFFSPPIHFNKSLLYMCLKFVVLVYYSKIKRWSVYRIPGSDDSLHLSLSPRKINPECFFFSPHKTELLVSVVLQYTATILSKSKLRFTFSVMVTIRSKLLFNNCIKQVSAKSKSISTLLYFTKKKNQLFLCVHLHEKLWHSTAPAANSLSL